MTNFLACLKNKEKQKQILSLESQISRKIFEKNNTNNFLNDAGTMNLTTKTMPTPQITARIMFFLLIN